MDFQKIVFKKKTVILGSYIKEVQGNYYRKTHPITCSTCKIHLVMHSTRLTARSTCSTCLFTSRTRLSTRSTRLSTSSTRLSTRSIRLSTRSTRLSTLNIRLSTRSIRLSIPLSILSTHLSTCSASLSTCSIYLSTRKIRSTICRSFYNWSIKSKGYTCSLVSDTDVKKSCFLCRVKIPYQQFSTFLSFMNIFRSSHSQMFFKIGTIKNFTIVWIKKSPQIFINSFFYRTSPVTAKVWMSTDF